MKHKKCLLFTTYLKFLSMNHVLLEKNTRKMTYLVIICRWEHLSKLSRNLICRKPRTECKHLKISVVNYHRFSNPHTMSKSVLKSDLHNMINAKWVNNATQFFSLTKCRRNLITVCLNRNSEIVRSRACIAGSSVVIIVNNKETKCDLSSVLYRFSVFTNTQIKCTWNYTTYETQTRHKGSKNHYGAYQKQPYLDLKSLNKGNKKFKWRSSLRTSVELFPVEYAQKSFS